MNESDMVKGILHLASAPDGATLESLVKFTGMPRRGASRLITDMRVIGLLQAKRVLGTTNLFISERGRNHLDDLARKKTVSWKV